MEILIIIIWIVLVIISGARRIGEMIAYVPYTFIAIICGPFSYWAFKKFFD